MMGCMYDGAMSPMFKPVVLEDHGIVPLVRGNHPAWLVHRFGYDQRRFAVEDVESGQILDDHADLFRFARPLQIFRIVERPASCLLTHSILCGELRSDLPPHP